MKLNLIVNALITLNLHQFLIHFMPKRIEEEKKIKKVINLVGLPSILLFVDKT